MSYKKGRLSCIKEQNNLAVETCPQRRLDLASRSIDGETVILNREAGVLHQLNTTASFIWNCCDGTCGVDDIVERLANVYDIDCATGRRDVSQVLMELRKLNLLEIPSEL